MGNGAQGPSEQSQSICGNERGFSLLSTVVAVAIGGIVVMGVTRMMSHSTRTMHGLRLLDDVNYIKKNVDTELGCQATFNGALPQDGIPAICREGARDIVLRQKSNGQPFPNDDGGWEILGRCDASQYQGLIAYVRRTGDPIHPLFERRWSQTRDGNDMFRDQKKFCLNYFSQTGGGGSPTDDDPPTDGYGEGGRCRLVQEEGTANNRGVVASCDRGTEYMMSGSGSCRTIVGMGSPRFRQLKRAVDGGTANQTQIDTYNRMVRRVQARTDRRQYMRQASVETSRPAGTHSWQVTCNIPEGVNLSQPVSRVICCPTN